MSHGAQCLVVAILLRTISVRIDPYSLELFVAVVEEGSIARAAARGHISSSAISRRIADLETSLGALLLTRSPSGVELTEAGAHVFSRARALNDQLQSLVGEVHSLAGQVSGTVRLYANASAIVGFLPELLTTFKAEYPLVEIALIEQISSDVLRACVDGRADVGISSAVVAPDSLDSWHFADDPLLVVVPRQHELASVTAPTFSDVLDFSLVALQAGGTLDQELRERAAAMGKPLQVSVTVNSFDAQCRMIEAGLGIGIVPTSAASAFAGSGNFIRHPLDAPWAASRTLRVHAFKRSARRKAVAALIFHLSSHSHQG